MAGVRKPWHKTQLLFMRSRPAPLLADRACRFATAVAAAFLEADGKPASAIFIAVVTLGIWMEHAGDKWLTATRSLPENAQTELPLLSARLEARHNDH
jgi:hypothetical protein